MKLLIAVAALIVAAPLNAQNSRQSPQGWSLSLWGGGAAFTAFQQSTVQAFGPSPSGGFERRDFPRRVGAKTAGTFAAAVAYWPNRSWGLRLFGSYSPSRFETLITESGAAFMNVPRSSDETGSLAALSIVSTDLQALIRLPAIRRRLVPYTFVGAGIVRYGTSPIDAVPEEARTDFASGSQIKPAARIGVGASLPLGRDAWSLSFELSDQIARTPLARGGDRSVSMTNAIAFMIGLNLSL